MMISFSYHIICSLINLTSMSQQDYDVIISDKEYKELKENKAKVLTLEKKIKELIEMEDVRNLRMQKLEREVEKHKEEIQFLTSTIASIGQPRASEQNEEIDVLNTKGNSASYEVLGESVMFPKKINTKVSELKATDLIKKFQSTLEHIGYIEENIESQQALIKKLNQMNKHKDQLLTTKSSEAVLEFINSSFSLKLQKIDEIKAIFLEKKKLQEQIKNREKDKKSILTENSSLREEIKKLGNVITVFEDKLKKAQASSKQINKVVKESSSMGDRPYRIKLLIDQHIKEMEKSLGDIGGISSQQIKVMLKSELKSLLEYIPKSLVALK